ncbi:DinB family protein [Taibaiella lutea]|uniref:DinB family protein n=1 Tax=Taibaiella lutea TaxID=2608001 RepID=A0A5M6CN08_9BACT|nr:DinB family protein [Taibaiella lutea]KAA5536608.1 DinB family protein [Taibaiella lutea]
MTSKIQEWNKKIDHVTREFTERFADLSKDEITRKPNAESWSVAENLQHLIVVNESYFPLFNQVKQGTYKPPFVAKIPLLVNVMGKLILKSVAPSRRKKLKTFSIWEPSQAKVQGDVLKEFNKQQTILKTWIDNLQDKIQKDTIIASPANQSVVYTLEKAIDIIVTHEQRHLNQAIEAFDTIFENQYKLDI